MATAWVYAGLDVAQQQTPVLYAVDSTNITKPIIDAYNTKIGCAGSSSPGAAGAAPAPGPQSPAPKAPSTAPRATRHRATNSKQQLPR